MFKPEQERRAASRHKVNLDASVIITAVKPAAGDASESYHILQAQLLDVSRTGLGLIISNSDIQQLKAFGDDLTFRLLLPLPAEAIELEAVPVRYERLNETETRRIVVGANVTNMKGRDRVLFMDFINRFENSEQGKNDS